MSTTRAGLLRAAALGGAALAGGGLIAKTTDDGASAAKPSKEMDRQILNFLLLQEYVQDAFYDQTLKSGRLKGELRELARTVGRHEKEHMALLKRLLGSDARERPETDFSEAAGNPDAFVATALELEETATAAYIGQGASLTRGVITDVASIVSVEARHAAWLRDIAGKNPAPRGADRAMSDAEATASLRRQGFLK
jgi:rubrerythrin